MPNFRKKFYKFILNRFSHRLWPKIALILVAGISVPVFFLGALLLNNFDKSVKNSVLEAHKEAAVRLADRVGLFLGHCEGILNTSAATLGVLSQDPWQEEGILVELVLNQPLFLRASISDLSGKLVATSELGDVYNHGYSKDMLGNILRGETYISGVELLDKHTPCLTMAVPLKREGRTSGVLCADVDLRGLWEMLDGAQLNKAGRAMLLAADGTLLVHPDKKRVLKKENFRGQQDADSALAGLSGAVEISDRQGGNWVSGFAPVSKLGMALLVRQEHKTAYFFARAMRVQLWLIIILSEIIACFASIFLAIFFSGRIQALIFRLKGAVYGEPQDNNSLSKRDEIGELMAIISDLTERLKETRLKERLSSIGEAAVWVAHELKNSLLPLKTFVQFFPSKHHNGEFMDKFRSVVPVEIDRCEKMLKELSELSGQSELKLARVNVKEIMDDVLKMMEEKFLEASIKAQVHLEDSNLYAMADAELLKRAFMNLIINAVEAMPGGGVIAISMDLISRGGSGGSYIEVKVRDNGIGIQEGKLRDIFKPYKAAKRNGRGLGLAISRRIIEEHGGNISVESKPGMGTTFTLVLPALINAGSITNPLAL
jgi:signal transduction histidine kinase